MAKDLSTLAWDYVMFVAFIAFTVFAPLWSRIFGKKKEHTKADYVFATGGISIVAIMLSIARGTLGVRTVLGYPSELFYRGTGMWEVVYGMASAYPIVCFIFVPVYFNLGITSVYQYLDLRFKSRLVRCLAAATYTIRQILSLGVSVYTPSVALSTVIGIPYWASISSISIICIFFTLKGGLKQAINADVIQTVTVILVTLVVIGKGLIVSGGPQRVYEINRDAGRLNFFQFTGDMTVRVDTTSAWLGQLFMSLSQFGCQQNFMQRYMSLKNISAVKQAMMSNIPIIIFFFSLAWFSGMVIFASYINCDPLADGYIKKPDEILPFFVEDQLAVIPGFVGIFMAMLFNGSLCMMVSNLNSLATVIWEDFLSLLPTFKHFNDKQQLTVIKSSSVICGLIVMATAFGVGFLSGVIESSMIAFGATSGPLLGCFMLAMLVPIANWKGTATGMITACATIIWIVFGSATVDKTGHSQWLPTSTEGCSNETFASSIHKPDFVESWLLTNTPNITTTPTYPTSERTPLEYFYSVSYMYYSLIGTIVCVVIGIIVSYMTQNESDKYDSALLHPAVLKCSQFFSGKKPYYIKEADNTTNMEKNAKINVAIDIKSDANIIKEKQLEADKKNPAPIQVIFNSDFPNPMHKNNNNNNNNNSNASICEQVRSETDITEQQMGTYRQVDEKNSI